MGSNSALSSSPRFGGNLKFHSNLEISRSVLRNFPEYYQVIFRWGKVTLPSTVACQLTWFNKHIKIDSESTCFLCLLNYDLNFVGQLFDLKITCSFNAAKLSVLYHNFGKDNIKNFTGNLSNVSIQDHQLVKCHRILNLENS